MSIHPELAAVIKANPWIVVPVFGCGLAIFALSSSWILNLVSRKLSGWGQVLTQFPMVEVHPLGREYKRQSGEIGRCRYDGAFTLRLAHEGVCVYPNFARHAPCLVPWASIQNVDVSNRCIFLFVRYERAMQLVLPADALQEVRAYVPPESFHEAVSVFQAMKSALQSGVRPRWLWPWRK